MARSPVVYKAANVLKDLADSLSFTTGYVGIPSCTRFIFCSSQSISFIRASVPSRFTCTKATGSRGKCLRSSIECDHSALARSYTFLGFQDGFIDEPEARARSTFGASSEAAITYSSIAQRVTASDIRDWSIANRRREPCYGAYLDASLVSGMPYHLFPRLCYLIGFMCSRYWAEVVLDTPVLWSKISVSPHDSLEKARRKLSRSKSCPLDISISFGPQLEHLNTVTEHVIHAMDLFRPALWRTRSFSLNVPTRPQAHAALSRCQEDAPVLESLTIQIYRSQDDHYSSPPLPLFRGHTPRLRSCSLTSFNFGWDARLVSRLRVLKLGGYFNGFVPSPNILLGILRQCPELEEFALRNMSDVDSDSCYPPSFQETDVPVSSKVVRLPRLSKVSFYYSGIVFTRQIMNQITFPNLESLEMCYLENVTPLLQLLYTQALTRLPLQSLRIESCFFNEPKLVALLRKLPSMTKLELVDVDDASSSLLNVRNRLCLDRATR